MTSQYEQRCFVFICSKTDVYVWSYFVFVFFCSSRVYFKIQYFLNILVFNNFFLIGACHHEGFDSFDNFLKVTENLGSYLPSLIGQAQRKLVFMRNWVSMWPRNMTEFFNIGSCRLQYSITYSFYVCMKSSWQIGTHLKALHISFNKIPARREDYATYSWPPTGNIFANILWPSMARKRRGGGADVGDVAEAQGI